MQINNKNKQRILSLAEQGRRLDGRGLEDFREIEIQTNVVSLAEGSARVKIGDTEVLAGVKLGLGEPYPDSLDQGSMMVTIELSPLASPNFESGPPSPRSIELARTIDRGIRESEVIDFKKLCIEEGKKVFMVMIDIYMMNDSGNLTDASALAAIAALKTAVMPKLNKDNEIEYGEHTKKSLPLKKNFPITTTAIKIDNVILIDPTLDEEAIADAKLSVAIADKKIHAMQKSGPAPLSQEEIEKIVDIAEKKEAELKKFL